MMSTTYVRKLGAGDRIQDKDGVFVVTRDPQLASDGDDLVVDIGLSEYKPGKRQYTRHFRYPINARVELRAG